MDSSTHQNAGAQSQGGQSTNDYKHEDFKHTGHDSRFDKPSSNSTEWSTQRSYGPTEYKSYQDPGIDEGPITEFDSHQNPNTQQDYGTSEASSMRTNSRSRFTSEPPDQDANSTESANGNK